MAGFIKAPEYFPIARIKIPTTPPNVEAIRTSASTLVIDGRAVVIMTDAGPIRTRMYVPTSSEKHSLFHGEREIVTVQQVPFGTDSSTETTFVTLTQSIKLISSLFTRFGSRKLLER